MMPNKTGLNLSSKTTRTKYDLLYEEAHPSIFENPSFCFPGLSIQGEITSSTDSLGYEMVRISLG